MRRNKGLMTKISIDRDAYKKLTVFKAICRKKGIKARWSEAIREMYSHYSKEHILELLGKTKRT